MRLFLSEHKGDARPDTLRYLRVREVDAVADEFGVKAKDAAWARESELRDDPDGNRLWVGTTTDGTLPGGSGQRDCARGRTSTCVRPPKHVPGTPGASGAWPAAICQARA